MASSAAISFLSAVKAAEYGVVPEEFKDLNLVNALESPAEFPKKLGVELLNLLRTMSYSGEVVPEKYPKL